MTAVDRRYRDLVEQSLDGIVLHTDGVIAYANRTARVMLGCTTRNGLVGRRVDEFLPPPWLPVIHDELLAPGSVQTSFVERSLTRLDGTRLGVEVTAQAVVSDGKPSVHMTLRDVDERIRARAGTESQGWVFASDVPIVLWTATPEGRVLSVLGDVRTPLGEQLAAAQLSGVPFAVAAVGATCDSPDDSTRIAYDAEIAGSSYGVYVETRHGAEDGRAGHIGVALDISPMVQRRAESAASAQMASLGTLAAGLAHEINSALTIISGSAALLRLPGAARDAKEVDEIAAATDRAAEVIADLLALTMQDVHRPTPIHVNDVVRAAAEQVARAAPRSPRLELDLAPGLIDVDADPKSLERALVALGLDAVKAPNPAGPPGVVTSALHGPGAGADGVRIQVHDSGAAMTAREVATAFEPFSGVTVEGRRSGLGLAMTRAVVTRLGGTVALASAPGEGTRVTIDLRGRPPAAPPRRVLGIGRADVSARLRALVVDDEPAIRRISAMLLLWLGYECITAASGDAAIELFAASPHDFAFVLLDVVMPGMTGLQVLPELLRLDPDVRVILCTGHPRDTIDPGVFGSGNVEYLGKPFTREELERLVGVVTAHGLGGAGSGGGGG